MYRGHISALSYVTLSLEFFGLGCYELLFWMGVLAYFLIFLIGMFAILEE